MAEFVKGTAGGAGNKLIVDLNDLVSYGINLLDVQMMLIRCNIPRINRGSEPRIWVRYKANYYICEIGADEIRTILNSNTNWFDQYQQRTLDGIRAFINDYQQYINQL